MKKIMEIKGVSKTFSIDGMESSPTLEGINLDVHEGEFLAILGPSGSGKSTLLRIMAGLVPATEGSVTYLGQPVRGVNPAMSMVFQSFALFPWLTVLENVMLGLENKKMSKQEKREKSLNIIDIVGLDGYENAYPKELSGGMRQRVGNGRALVSDPDILVMDEPFSALDVLTAENLRRDLLELWLDKKISTKAIILVTHGIEEAVYMADRAIILSSGPAKIVSDIPITIPRWRDKKSPEFTDLVDRIYSFMTKKEIKRKDTKPMPHKHIVAFPYVSAGALTGFLEWLADVNEKIDLYKLAERFAMDTEEFFPIVDLASILGFAKVVEGDIELTAEGNTFAQASVLERKELFKEQLMKNIPFINRMLAILESKSNKHMNIEFFEEQIAAVLGDEVAKKQIRLLVDWGRYAELIEYDQSTELIYLETSFNE